MAYPLGNVIVLRGLLDRTVLRATVDTANQLVTLAPHGMVDGDTVAFKKAPQGVDATDGMEQEAVYYVRDKTATTFRIAGTAGGAALTLMGGPHALVRVLTDATATVVLKLGGVSITAPAATNPAKGVYEAPYTPAARGTYAYNFAWTGAYTSTSETKTFIIV